jgi:type I restriction enzyme R subunit
VGANKFTESEWTTRKTRIEPKLRAAGWNVVPFDTEKTLADYHCCAIGEYPTSAGPVDYALCLDGRILESQSFS